MGNSTHKRSQGRGRFPSMQKAFVPVAVPTETQNESLPGHKALFGSRFERTEQMKEFDSSLFWLLRSLGGRTDRMSNLWLSSSQKSMTAIKEGSEEGSFLNLQNSAAMAEADSCYQRRFMCIQVPKTALNTESWLTNKEQ